ncbi:MAG: AAA family ATPase [Clostridia bacterium]|nr:AAA family ATPase [Clostridia bacterium]
MKLIKCYVSAFGKLKDFTFDFSQGLNTVKQDNGWGKSTFATFIKAMFYGLNDSKRSVAENERIKFRPWNSTEKFGGYIQFEWGNKQFKLERFFGAKESEDTVRLFDAETGKEFSNTQNLGRRIFEIDEEGFLSTTYFSQKDFEVKSNTSITAKFNAVCEMQDSEAFDRALNKVEDKAKSYKYRGDRGLIPDAKREIHAVDEQLVRAEQSVYTLKTLKNEADVLSGDVNDLQLKVKKLTDQITLAGKLEAIKIKKQRYQKLVSDKEKLSLDKKTAEDVLAGNYGAKDEIRITEEKNRELIGVTARVEAAKSELDKHDEISNVQPKTKLVGLDLTLITISALLLVGLLVSIIVSGFSVATIVLIPLLVASVAITLFRILTANASKKREKDRGNAIFLAKREEFDIINERKVKLEKEVDLFINKFNLGEKFDWSTSISYIAKVFDVYAEILTKIKEIDLELDGMKGDVESFSAVIDDRLSVYEIESELKRTEQDYTKKMRELADKRSAIRLHEDLAGSYTDLESKKSELIDKIGQYEEEQEVLNLTAKFLKQADENLKIKYKAPLQSSLKKYFEMVAGNDKDVNIDVDLKVTVNEDSGQKQVDYYSKGYQNLFEICKRFALTDVLYTGEKPFIILDDPFYNLDDEKLSSALELIKKLAQEYQVLYLVCHDSRRA